MADNHITVLDRISTWLVAVVCFGVCTIPNTVVALERDGLCDHAAAQAAAETDVPLDILRAITRVETGRARGTGIEPWPWTVNMEGKGAWFTSRDNALAFVFKHFKQGARSFDIGCFQINFRWHNQGFDSIDQMFDPLDNALYAARFLDQLYQELGNWSDAVGAYHSRTSKHATRYQDRFEDVLASLDRPTQEHLQSGKITSPTLRFGLSPVLTDHNRSAGSLVPMGQSRDAVPLAFFGGAHDE